MSDVAQHDVWQPPEPVPTFNLGAIVALERRVNELERKSAAAGPIPSTELDALGTEVGQLTQTVQQLRADHDRIARKLEELYTWLREGEEGTDG